MTDTRDEGRTEQLWECPECGEFFHDSEQVGGFGEPAWDMPAECGPCGGIEMTLVGPMTTEEYRRRKKLVLRAPTSDTEDVGEEELEADIVRIICEAIVEDRSLTQRERTLGHYAERAAEKILARLRRTPETEREGWVERRCWWCSVRWSERGGHCPETPYVDGGHNFQTKHERNTPHAATQDPNAGGEDVD